ncbi:GntR family transcriptional regulator [Rhodospirillum rubrum]|uniref:aminotransferase-like domain-containing protein n=1 Tax=Rhodospirillum rubrum TaxID=1085 RepID=UPI0019044D66|nr:PLP-dependent aminotransferase family protein [Rhodospirillum rubrum]MBK1676153.1 GntR family transcriptional regulator [Rhodospirillum rubrum]
MDWKGAYAQRAGAMRASEIRELLKLLDQPDVLSFAGGIPDPTLFPTEAAREAYGAVLGEPGVGPLSLQYSISEGYVPLRRWIVAHMAGRGVVCDEENIVITSGSQQGLDYLGKLLISPGDSAYVTRPTYLGALQVFNPYEPRYADLAFGEGAPTPGQCREAALAAGGRPALAYVVPDFANPTGETLSREDRLRLLEHVSALGVPLIEDAAYAALRYAGAEVASCLALDIARVGDIDHSRVIYCGSFSKTIAPGLRVGWICAARDLVQKVVLTKQAADLHSATINQMVMHRLAEAIYDEQVKKIIGVYAARRDALLAALAKFMPEGVSWTAPEGGMFVWVTLPANIDGAELLAESLRDERVAFVPGGAFFFDGSGANTLRLNFSLPSEAVINEGIARLARLIARKNNQFRAA